MADSKTTKKPSPPILGGIFNAKPTYQDKITSDSGKTSTGYGATSGEAQKNASKKNEKK